MCFLVICFGMGLHKGMRLQMENGHLTGPRHAIGVELDCGFRPGVGYWDMV